MGSKVREGYTESKLEVMEYLLKNRELVCIYTYICVYIGRELHF